MHIHLPQPCHENWDSMSPEGKGRHCQACNKVVHDFTSFTDADLMAFFKSGTQVCGRFNSAQIGRKLNHKTLSVSKFSIAACSLLMILSGDIHAQNELQVSIDSSIQTQIPELVQLSRVVRIRFEKAISRETNIARMRLKMPGFSIDTLVDSTNIISVSIPEQINHTMAEIDLYNHLGDSFHFTSVTFVQGEIGFTNTKGEWAIMPAPVSPFNFPVYPYPHLITMGIPAPITLFDYPVTQIIETPTDSLKLYTFSDTLITEKPDTRPGKSDKKVMPIKHLNKRLPIGLLLGVLVAVIGLIVIAIRALKKK